MCNRNVSFHHRLAMQHRLVTLFVCLGVILSISACLAESNYEMYRRGTTALARGHYAEAAEILTQYYNAHLASETDAKFDRYKAEAMIMIGQSYLGLRQYASARNWLQRPLTEFANESKFRAEADYLLATCLKEEGRATEATAKLQDILSEYSSEKKTCALARIALSVQLGSQGQLLQARQALQPLIDDSEMNGDAETLETLGRRLLGLGDTAGATAIFAKLLTLAESTWKPADLATLKLQILSWSGDYAKTIEQAEALLIDDPDDARATAEISYLRAHAYDMSGQVDKALDAYDALATYYSSRTDKHNRELVSAALMRSGILLEGRMQASRAMAKYLQVINDYSDTPQAVACRELLQKLQAGGGDE